MKKTAYYYLSLVAIMAGTLVACQEDDMGYTSEEIARAKFEKEYQENFERDYGKIAEGHTWGFNEGELSHGKTRAANTPTRYKIVRQQGYVDLPGNQRDYFPVDPQMMQGTYAMAEKQYAGHNCPDEVTTAEKLYVFYYLRTHPNQGTTTCPLDNYFLQDLHQDPYPGSYDANGNVTGTTHCPGWSYMNNLYFDAEHFNDYNGTGYSPDYYVVKTDVKNPSYQDSYGTSGDPAKAATRENRYRYYYIPAFSGTIPGTEVKIDYPGGYYLCFDYESYKMEGGDKVYAPHGEPDNVYNDWVIKITAGQYNTYRVFCEDLGSTLDLDFNDLVFDYADYGQGLEVNVLALVGTLKIDMIVKGTTEHIKTGNQIQESVNKKYYFAGATINDVKISVQTVNGQGQCFIENTPGKAPYLLKVAAGTAWPSENQRIERKYPKFSDYVKAPGINEAWWNNFNDYPDITPGQN